jgi:hypothetical protein
MRETTLHVVADWLAVPLTLLGAEHQHQATINVTPFRDGSCSGWGFIRAGRDFTDDEMVIAARLQPVVMVKSGTNVMMGSAITRHHAPRSRISTSGECLLLSLRGTVTLSPVASSAPY